MRQAWDEVCDTNYSGLREPIRPSLLNGAERIRQELKKTLGTDLTVASNINHFWHSGPVDMANPSNWQQKHPHKWMWAVMNW